MKQVQISEELFKQLAEFHLLGNEEGAEEIHHGLSKKLDALARHQLYTNSKIAPTPQERETAQQAYLDEVGYRDSYRY